MPRKARSDSTAMQISAMLNAATPLPNAPAHVRLGPEHRPFWEDILRARTREEWTESDLVVAAQLARVQYDIERESEALDAEGTVIKNDRGTPVANPRAVVLERFAARQMALMRALLMAGVARGDKRDFAKSRDMQRKAEQARESLADEGLLAT